MQLCVMHSAVSDQQEDEGTWPDAESHMLQGWESHVQTVHVTASQPCDKEQTHLHTQRNSIIPQRLVRTDDVMLTDERRSQW